MNGCVKVKLPSQARPKETLPFWYLLISEMQDALGKKTASKPTSFLEYYVWKRFCICMIVLFALILPCRVSNAGLPDWNQWKI